ncbi:unnamed protein product [Meloidogyne enterolobii]|uniref:Uncharacterized protein n=1 Tax=Meloidogyne enterolobii TaxID=390850 RepID=A0ACB1A704_MELEN
MLNNFLRCSRSKRGRGPRPKAKLAQMRTSAKGSKRNHTKAGELRRAQSETKHMLMNAEVPKRNLIKSGRGQTTFIGLLKILNR